MAQDDWAIVVGIGQYPGLTNGDLLGPINDATDFAKWLTTNPGPDVPLAQIIVVQSPQLNERPRPEDAKPTLQQIYDAFGTILDVSDVNLKNRKGRRVGRRLYVYFAGHGFEPAREQAVLLLANAVEKRALYHVPGRSYPDYCYRAGIFDEVVLFMDCCRENYAKVPLMDPPLVETIAPKAPEIGRRLYGFGTKWSRKAWEKPMGDGKVHGVFTTALLDGLKGKAAEDGRVTAASLASWLYQRMVDYLDSAELSDPEIPREPSFNIDPPPGDDFVLVEGLQPGLSLFPVRVNVVPASAGRTFEVLNGDGLIVHSAVVTPPQWDVRLRRGLYKLRMKEDAEEKLFEVPSGSGEVVYV